MTSTHNSTDQQTPLHRSHVPSWKSTVGNEKIANVSRPAVHQTSKYDLGAVSRLRRVTVPFQPRLRPGLEHRIL